MPIICYYNLCYMAFMVDMAKRLTHRIVAPARMGSIPIIHPILGRSQAVRQRVLAPLCVGSNPAAPAKGRAENARLSLYLFSCGRGGIGRRTRLRIWRAIVRVRVPPSAPNGANLNTKSRFYFVKKQWLL